MVGSVRFVGVLSVTFIEATAGAEINTVHLLLVESYDIPYAGVRLVFTVYAPFTSFATFQSLQVLAVSFSNT